MPRTFNPNDGYGKRQQSNPSKRPSRADRGQKRTFEDKQQRAEVGTPVPARPGVVGGRYKPPADRTYVRCSATAKNSGEQCKNWAVDGYRTCRVHGAGSPYVGRPGGRPPVTGASSKVRSARLAAKIADFKSKGDPTDLTEEVASMRAVIALYMEDLEDEKLTKEEVIERVVKLNAEVVSSVTKIQSMLAKGAFGVPELQHLRATFIRLILKYVSKDKHAEFLDELNSTVPILGGSDD